MSEEKKIVNPPVQIVNVAPGDSLAINWPNGDPMFRINGVLPPFKDREVMAAIEYFRGDDFKPDFITRQHLLRLIEGLAKQEVANRG